MPTPIYTQIQLRHLALNAVREARCELCEGAMKEPEPVRCAAGWDLRIVLDGKAETVESVTLRCRGVCGKEGHEMVIDQQIWPEKKA